MLHYAPYGYALRTVHHFNGAAWRDRSSTAKVAESFRSTRCADRAESNLVFGVGADQTSMPAQSLPAASALTQLLCSGAEMVESLFRRAAGCAAVMRHELWQRPRCRPQAL